MKKYLSLFLLFGFLFLIFTSCKIGLHEAFGRPDEVNQRSPIVKKIDGTEFDPKINDVNLKEEKFSVVIISDVHFGSEERHDEDFFKKLSEIKNKNESEYPAKFVICVGDCVDYGRKSEYDLYSMFCKKLKDDFSLVVYSIVGNHDLYNSGYSNWKDTVYPYTSSYTFTTGEGEKKISWYFLDSGNGTLGKSQLESFQELAFSDINPKIVITHYPIYAGGGFYYTMQNRVERDLLLSTFAQTNTILTMEGHLHEYKSFDYEGYFSEYLIGGYFEYRDFAVIYVNTKDGTCSFERHTY